MTKGWFTPDAPPVRTEETRSAWKSVLVPLDGSVSSAWAVARARRILELQGISVTLLRVIECEEDRANDLGYQMDPRHREACDALAAARAGLMDPFVEVSADVRFGDPATEILREIAEGNHDVVLMSTYGRTGPSRALFGRVAQRVLLSSPIPLLLFRPRLGLEGELSRPEAIEPSRFKRLLVALDGSATADEIFPVVERMARTLGSELHLFRALSSGSKGWAGRDAAEEDLREWKSSLASGGVASQVIVRTGDAAATAFALIRELGIDSVALTTHARTGLARAVYGSVTQDLMRGADVPILTLCNLRHRLPLPASAREHRHASVG